MTDPAVRLIAFYLPQYHPIAENDAWWGKGFTDWDNVVRARPQFRGHQQPHLPAELGFYDLRVPEVRQAQADLARAHGVHGFCYYHYWFNGHRLLHRPFDEVFHSGAPDFPFCLCWANENWTRIWDGGSQHVLIQQNYTAEDDRQHLRALLPAFADGRYIRIHGKPLFAVYRASRLPDPRATTDRWRDEARRAGLGDLFLCKVESFPDEHGDPARQGFDAAVEFAPDWLCVVPQLGPTLLRAYWRLRAVKRRLLRHAYFKYARLARRMLAKPPVDYVRFPGVTPSWDNTARRRQGSATILHGSTPERYGSWLTAVLRRRLAAAPEERIVFVNAWNEWAEGNHLEPCARWGRAYLEATRTALQEVTAAVPPPEPRLTHSVP